MYSRLFARLGAVSLHDEEKWHEAQNHDRQNGNHFDVAERGGLLVNHERHQAMGLVRRVYAAESFGLESLGQPTN